MLVKICEELENIDDQYTDKLWFEDIDQKVFFFKHRVHNWLREVEKWNKSGRLSKKVAQSHVQSPALPGYQKGNQQKKWQLRRS